MPVYNLTIDDASPLIVYQGIWSDTNIGDPSYVRYANTTFHATESTLSTATFTFNGTGVYLYGAKRDNHGSYTVTIDDHVVQDANGAGDDVYQTLLYGTSDLDYGLHRVVLTNTGAPSYMDLDFVVVTTGDGQTSTTSTDVTLDDPGFAYDDDWGSVANGWTGLYLYYTQHVACVLHAQARINFSGNAIKLYGATSVNHGLFSVSLDGSPVVSRNGTAPANIFRPQQLLCSYDGLPDGDHILIVENSSGACVDLDYAVISKYAVVLSGPSSAAATVSGAGATVTQGQPAPTLESAQHDNHLVPIIASVIGGLALLMLLTVGYFVFFRGRRSKAWSNVADAGMERARQPIGQSGTQNMEHDPSQVRATVPTFQDGTPRDNPPWTQLPGMMSIASSEYGPRTLPPYMMLPDQLSEHTSRASIVATPVLRKGRQMR